MNSKLLLIATVLLLSLAQHLYSNPAQLKQALKYYEEDKYEQAISIYNKIIDKHPTNITALLGRANCYLSLNEFDQAITDMNICLTIDTLNAKVYNILGIAKMYSDSIAYAMDDINKAISLDSNLADAYSNRALLNMSFKLFENAEIDLLRAIELDPSEAIYYNYLGFAQYRCKEYNKAIENYNKAIYKGFVNSEIYLKRANVFIKLNKYTDAIADYTKSIELDSMQIDAFINRAYAYYQSGDIKSAEIDKAKTQEINNKIALANNDSINTDNTKYFTHHSGKFSVLMPEQLHSLILPDTFGVVQMLTREKIKTPTDTYGVGMILEYIENTQEKLGISEPSELANYCRALSTETGQNAFQYQPFYEKQKQLPNGSFYQMSKIGIKFQANSPAYISYTVGFIQKNQLILIKFIYPELLSFKYENVLQRAVDSFKFE